MKQTLKIGQKYRVIKDSLNSNKNGMIVTVATISSDVGSDCFQDENGSFFDMSQDELQLVKPNTKKVKKYKYIRKEIWDNLTKFIRINTSTGRYAIDPDDWFKCRKDLLATKQEDNKDYRYVYCCPVHGEYYKVCPKCNPTPSPLEIEEIEELGIENLVKPFDKFVPQYRINHSFMTTINKLIRNQKKLISLTKRNIK